MSFRTLSFTAILSCLFVAKSFAQVEHPKAADLKQQIERLKQQLNKVQNKKPEGLRVVEIGSRGLARNRGMVIRLYDLSDLFAVAPSYQAMQESDLSSHSRPMFPSFSGGAQNSSGGGGIGGGGMGGGGQFNVPNTTINTVKMVRTPLVQGDENNGHSTSLLQLIDVIEQVISPELWEDDENSASIAQLGNALLISADESTHSQIDNLLNLFRKRWGTLKTISVQAYWLWLNDEELQTLLASGDHPDATADNVKAFGLVKEDAWKKHLNKIRENAGQRPGYRAAVTCYNGQTVHTASGGQSLAVTNFAGMVTVTEDKKLKEKTLKKIEFMPVISLIQEGAALQVTPIANISGKTVMMDLHSRVCRLNGKPNNNPPKKIASSDTISRILEAIERTKVSCQRISTTLRIPVDRTMLVGGMTFEGQTNTAEPALYLFVKVSVQELRNDLKENEKMNAPSKPKATNITKGE